LQGIVGYSVETGFVHADKRSRTSRFTGGNLGLFIHLHTRLAPVIGPVMTATCRVFLAGVALMIYFRLAALDLSAPLLEGVSPYRHCQRRLSLPGLRVGCPTLPASYLVIVNSYALFGAILSTVWIKERDSPSGNWEGSCWAR
jgi:hypothetical protein